MGFIMSKKVLKLVKFLFIFETFLLNTQDWLHCGLTMNT